MWFLSMKYKLFECFKELLVNVTQTFFSYVRNIKLARIITWATAWPYVLL